MSEIRSSVLSGFSTHKEGLSKHLQFIPVLQKACSVSSMKEDLSSHRIGRRPTKKTKLNPTADSPDQTMVSVIEGNKQVLDNKEEGIPKCVKHGVKQVSNISGFSPENTPRTSNLSPQLSFNQVIDDTTIQLNSLSDGNEQKIGCESRLQPHPNPLPLPLPEWAESVHEHGYILSSSLFQPCTDSTTTNSSSSSCINSSDDDEGDQEPIPSTKTEKEMRRNARRKKIEEMKKLEQSEQRRARFMKRQKRFDYDDGDPINQSLTTTATKRSKKKVMWEEEGNLLEFHIYSPVRVTEDRELTPVVNS